MIYKTFVPIKKTLVPIKEVIKLTAEACKPCFVNKVLKFVFKPIPPMAVLYNKVNVNIRL